MTEEYRVPKHRIPATVRMADGAERSVELFAGDHAERHTGPERPSDLLGRDASFFPVEDDEEGFLLLHKPAVSLLTVALEAEVRPEPVDAEDRALVDPEMEGAVRTRVRMVLDDGTEIRGLTAQVLPPGGRRLQDFLNAADGFVRVRDGDRVHVVNTDRIARVAPD
mgnify:CR=1 FL=1